MGKAKAQQKLMDNLEDVFGKVELTSKGSIQYGISNSQILNTNVCLCVEFCV